MPSTETKNGNRDIPDVAEAFIKQNQRSVDSKNTRKTKIITKILFSLKMHKINVFLNSLKTRMFQPKTRNKDLEEEEEKKAKKQC